MKTITLEHILGSKTLEYVVTETGAILDEKEVDNERS
jgi:hypothetical protein